MALALEGVLPRRVGLSTPEVLDEGFGSVVMRWGDLVVRIARNAEVGERHERETRLLAVLPDYLSVRVPGPVTLLPASADLPFGATVYPSIEGRPMSPRDAERLSLAEQIGTLLVRLHSVPLGIAAQADLPRRDFGDELPRLRAATSPFLSRVMSPDTWEALSVWWERTRAHESQSVLCHGDLWYENLLLDASGERVIAVIDWEEAAIADPALDFAAIRHLGARFTEVAHDAYARDREPDPTLLSRIENWRVIRELSALAYVMRNDLHGETRDIVEHLQDLLLEFNPGGVQ